MTAAILTKMTDAQGVEHTLVRPAMHPKFARACLVEWRSRDGKNRMWMMRQKAFWVPSDLMPAARLRLAPAEGGGPE